MLETAQVIAKLWKMGLRVVMVRKTQFSIYTTSYYIATCSTYPILYPAECGPNRYGYRCQGVCDCSVNGDCVPKSGCVCYEGYSGAHCETGVYMLCQETAGKMSTWYLCYVVLLCVSEFDTYIAILDIYQIETSIHTVYRKPPPTPF